MSEEKKSDGRQVTLKNVRLSFTDSLVEKKATVKDGKESHGCNFIIDPTTDSGKANIAACLKAIEAAEIVHYGPEGVGKIAKVVEDPKRICLRKGEKFKNDDGEVYRGYEGMFGLTAKGPGGGKKRPVLLDRHKRPVDPADIEDVFQGGYYADAIVSFYCMSDKDKGGHGLFCTIELIRSRQEGEVFGGGARVGEAEIASLDDLDDEDPFDGSETAVSAGGNSLLD